VSSNIGFLIPAINCTQSKLMLMMSPSGDSILVCCIKAFICLVDCSTYRFLMPIPPYSFGMYTTALGGCMLVVSHFWEKDHQCFVFKFCKVFFLEVGCYHGDARLLGYTWFSRLPLLLFVSAMML
jgi:hypothetical protein